MLLEEFGLLHRFLREEAQDVRREVLQVREASLKVIDVAVDGLGQDAFGWQKAILHVENGEVGSSPSMPQHSRRIDVEEGLCKLVLHACKHACWLNLLLRKNRLAQVLCLLQESAEAKHARLRLLLELAFQLLLWILRFKRLLCQAPVELINQKLPILKVEVPQRNKHGRELPKNQRCPFLLSELVHYLAKFTRIFVQVVFMHHLLNYLSLLLLDLEVLLGRLSAAVSHVFLFHL